jgi:hypothetical protein
MQLLDNLFDDYSRKARLYPAFLTLLPLFVLAAAYTDWLKFDFSNVAWMIFAAAGLFFLSDFSRQRGKAVEQKLLQSWGGFPSQTLLRHTDPTFDHHTTDRYHRCAERIAEGLVLPTPSQEKESPAEADELYKSVSHSLLPLTRDKAQFSILYKENVTYGFRRNLFGLKSIAIILSVAAIIIVAVLEMDRLILLKMPSERGNVALAASTLTLVCWCFLVTKKSVRTAAHDYGRQLLMSLEGLAKS